MLYKLGVQIAIDAYVVNKKKHGRSTCRLFKGGMLNRSDLLGEKNFVLNVGLIPSQL